MELPGNKCAWQESFLSVHLSVFGKPAIFLGPGILDACPLETDDCVFFPGNQDTALNWVHADSHCVLKSSVRLCLVQLAKN